MPNAMAKPDLAKASHDHAVPAPEELSTLPREALEERCRHYMALAAEKERHLRELQHRAKNGLQMVISLLRLQHHRISDPAARAAYDQTMHRVEVLAILYRQVHESRSETHVLLDRYCQEVVETALANVGDLPVAVKVGLQIAPLTTSLYTAMPLGLILNELVMTGLRHAYPAEGRMDVALEAQPDGRVRLTVADNGRGLPPGFDAEADASHMLVEALATQLAADLDISHGSGTTMRLTMHL